MIPIPYHFNAIDRDACLHPDVRAEIEAARRRPGPAAATILQKLGARLRHRVRPRPLPAPVAAE